MKLTSALVFSALAGSSYAWHNTTSYFDDGRVRAVFHLKDGMSDPSPQFEASQPERRSVPAADPPVCYTNKCLRAMIAAPDDAASFCEAYLAEVFTAASDLAPFQRSCCSPSKASSACACLHQATAAPSGTLSQPTAVATPGASSSVPVGPGSPVDTTSAAGPYPTGTIPSSGPGKDDDGTPATTSAAGPGKDDDDTPATTSAPTNTATTNPTLPTTTSQPMCAPIGSACTIHNFADLCCNGYFDVPACSFPNGDTLNGVCF